MAQLQAPTLELGFRTRRRTRREGFGGVGEQWLLREYREDVLRVLQSAAPFVRRQLAPRLELREVPQIRFVHDDSIARGARVDELLRKIAEGKPVEDDEASP